MDADLVAALGSTPTVTEKLYAEAIEDSRLRAAEVQQYRADVKAIFDWFKTEYTKLPAEQRTEQQHLYERCLMKALDLRRQNMTTATTLATMDDVIADAVYIAGRIYSQLQQSQVGLG